MKTNLAQIPMKDETCEYNYILYYNSDSNNIPVSSHQLVFAEGI